MPFEPLRTDERLETPVRERDFDTHMLFGCGSFVVASFATYALGAWPFFALPNTHLIGALGVACAAGLLPALAFGAFASRRAGLAGACGFVGGAMAVAVFLFLRMEQVMMGYDMRDLPLPEYPRTWGWMLPAAWMVAAALVAGAFVGPLSRDRDDRG